MKKGTIIYMGNFELPDKNAAAHRVMNNGKIFCKLGYRVVYLGTVRGESFDGIRVSDHNENIYEEAYPTTTKAWVKHIFDTSNIEAVARQFNDVRLIITYNVPYATFKAVKKAFRKSSVKVVYDCTEWNNFAEGSFPKRIYKRIDEFQIRHFLPRKCKNIIVISKLMEEKYKRCNLLRLPPLVDTDDTIWHQKRKEHPSFEFCFAGTITNKERLDNIVSAFCQIADSSIVLRIIGLTQDEYTSIYPEQKNEIEANKRVLFMGELSHEETIFYTLSCDCYIFIREPSRKNMAGFPTKFAESYTCGVPIISTDVSDIKEYADENRITIIQNTSRETVKEAMLHAVRINSKKIIKKTFDYQNYVSETEEWISRIR